MDRLPDEILTNILGYLNAFELIQFCRAFERYSYFLGEKDITQVVNLSRRFETSSFKHRFKFNLCSYITTNFNCCHIRILKINGLYWIKAAQLRNMIRKLENLRELHAVDTELGIMSGSWRDTRYARDILLYYKLEKLAVSFKDPIWPWAQEIETSGCLNLKVLFLKLAFDDQHHPENYPLHFLRLSTHLEEIWICDECRDIYPINHMLPILMNCTENLKKIVIRGGTCAFYPQMLEDKQDWSQVFHCNSYNQRKEIILEKIEIPVGRYRSIYEHLDNELEKAWEVFLNHPKNLPCGPTETRLIHLKEDIQNIYFQDLNFNHTIFCNAKYINAAIQILTSKNCMKLKRLAFRTCLFLDDNPCNIKKTEPSFKRQRVGVQMKCDHHRFKKVAENLKSLSQLEITNCSRCTSRWNFSAYPFISSFENLQKLTLEISPLLDGSFLVEVIKTCKRLDSIRLTCMGQNEKFIINMCQALKEADALRDFRLEHNEIAISKLLDSFNSIKSRRLLRIFLKCDNLRYYALGSDIFSDFMKKNPQLVFFFMVVFNNTHKENTEIQKILNRYKKQNTAKQFYVKKDVTAFTGAFPVPPAHHDMIFNRTNVSVIDFEDF